MAFNLTLTHTDGRKGVLTLNPGDTLFVLGANGSGKSGLMHRFYSDHQATSRRISAHRQTWMDSNSIALSPAQKRQTEQNIRGLDQNPNARWRDDHSAQRPNISVYDLLEAENERARGIARAVDSREIDLANELSKKDAPIKVINELLRLSNVPIEISIKSNEQIIASKLGGAPFSIAELSDGERNAILIAADVLTVKAGTLIIIDEPERHLHRAIISPLLTHLFERRPDCAFVIATHDVMLPLDNPQARTLLLRGCTHDGSRIAAWDVDLLDAGAEIADELKRDILGARRSVLFVEGTEGSLDKQLYSLVFPEVSVVSKSSCSEVAHSVSSIRAVGGLHWIHAFGIVDNDRRTLTEIDELKSKGVYALPVFSVESIYYHPEIQRRVTERQSTVTGGDATKLVADAAAVAILAIGPHTQRLSERAVERALRAEIFQRLPGRAEIAAGTAIGITLDVAAKVSEERGRLETALKAGKLGDVIARYPVRETPALDAIAAKLGFQGRRQYEAAVRKLLIDEETALKFVRSLFGSLEVEITK